MRAEEHDRNSTSPNLEVADCDLNLIVEARSLVAQIVFGGNGIAQRMIKSLGLSARLRLVDARRLTAGRCK
jgi:hypothetical protein